MNTIHDPKKLSQIQGCKFYTAVAMLFVALLIVVNIITQKIIPLGKWLILTPGDLIYPLSYTLSIILTEVYGYAMSRRVIWMSLACNILIAIICEFAIVLPAASGWNDQAQFAAILGRTPQLVTASLSAFFVGEFTGTYLLAKIKISTSGKFLWLRTITATLIGQAIDCVVFTTIAFSTALSFKNMLTLGITSYFCKIFYQIIMTPGVYSLANFLKRHEHVDIYDKKTNFNPFNIGLK